MNKLLSKGEILRMAKKVAGIGRGGTEPEVLWVTGSDEPYVTHVITKRGTKVRGVVISQGWVKKIICQAKESLMDSIDWQDQESPRRG